MIHYRQIFNNKTLNIFTDASTKNVKGNIITAPGYVAVVGDNIVYQDIRILNKSSISEAELYAILMAIQYALINKDKFEVINIFSDSQFAVFGLREWIFNWINNIKDDKIYNSSNKLVAHQSLFMNIIYIILEYDLKINIYHNRGHFNENKIDEFIELFKKHNFLNDYIGYDTARAIMKYNDHIDNNTRVRLLDINNSNEKLKMLDYCARSDLDINHYKELLNI